MAAADPITSTTVDDILDYNFSDDDDPFADKPLRQTRDDKPTLSPRAAKRKFDDDKENFGLGLNKEVKITKKRKPVVKLDEARLLTQPGIPRLRTLARSGKVAKKLGFKGKGHEFSDVARLLNYYQLWLDGLYPRAKFADGLQLIEKAGHSKRMNIMRKEWIDEGKPGYLRAFESGEHGDGNAAAGATSGQEGDVHREGGQNDEHDGGLFYQESKNPHKPDKAVEPDDDDLDALLAESHAYSSRPSKPAEADSEGEDDLDALLAEQDFRRKAGAPPPPKVIEEDDDLDALMAEQEILPQHRESSKSAHQTSMPAENEEVELDDLDALLAGHDAEKSGRKDDVPATNTPSPTKEPQSQPMMLSSPLPNNPEEEDDLDALLAEHDSIR